MRRRIRPFRAGFRGSRRGLWNGFGRARRRSGSAFRPARRMIRRNGRRLMIGSSLAVLLFGQQAIKLSREDLDRIEQHTGRTSKQLTEEELFAAMEALNIKRLELTEEEAILVEKTADSRRLPGSCPRCGAPLRREQSILDTAQGVECSYCIALI